MTDHTPLFGTAGRTDSAAVLAAHEADYTPVAVAVQLLLTLVPHFEHVGEPRILLPACGSGCWARAARAVFPGSYLVGVEPRASEAANVAAACDESYVATLAAYIAGCTPPDEDGQREEMFDLVVDNIPFSGFSEYWPTMLSKAGLVGPDGLVAFYGLSQWGQAADAEMNLRSWSPSWQRRLGGRPAHRGTKKTDLRNYSFWVWSEEARRSKPVRPTWICEQMPVLPAAMRSWAPPAVPGTYPINPAFVAEIRGRYL